MQRINKMTTNDTVKKQFSISTFLTDNVLPAVMMGSLGLLYWAIRGTGDYGGMMGGAFAGLGWAICWQFLGRDGKPRPYASGWTFLAIVLGIAIGGMHGYGQFNSWVNGYWIYLDPSIIVDPAWGYAGQLQCGIAWGGTAGVLVAWTRAGVKPTIKDWLGRLVFGAAGAVGFVLVVIIFPAIALPLYDTGLYSDPSCIVHCPRAIETSINAAAMLGIFTGLFAHLVVKRDWQGVKAAAIMGIGFGLAFTISAAIFINDDIFGKLLWKPWEMTIGLIGGASIGLAYSAVNKPSDIDLKALESSVHFPSEKLAGENLTIFFALSLSIWNGIVGVKSAMIGNLFDADPTAATITRVLAIGCVIGLLAAFIISIVRFKQGKPATFIGSPVLMFAAGQAVLVIVGFLTSIQNPASEELVARLWIYAAFVAIGMSSFLLAAWLKRAR
jgi:hypothetical protein